MIWKGKELRTIGDLMTYGIDKCDIPEEAKQFMELYSEENPHACSNIGYLAGYYSQEKAKQIFEWFDVSHPIFGRTFPTPEAAFEAGKRIARERMKK
jgi:hypothetical protein